MHLINIPNITISQILPKIIVGRRDETWTDHVIPLKKSKHVVMLCQDKIKFHVQLETEKLNFGLQKNREIKQNEKKIERYQDGLHWSYRFSQYQYLPAGAYKNIKQTLHEKKTIDGCDSSWVNGYWKIRDLCREESSESKLTQLGVRNWPKYALLPL